MINKFISEDEKYIASLGNNSFAGSPVDGVFNTNTAILTSRRLYFSGRVVRFSGILPTVTHEEGVVNVEDITGTEIRYFNPIAYLIVAALLMFFQIVLSLARGYFGMGLITLFVSLIFCLLYILMRKTFFVVNYPGGSIGFVLKHAGIDNAHEFSECIHLAKDASRRRNRYDAK